MPKGSSSRSVVTRKSTFKQWIDSASVLLQQLEGDCEHIQKVLDWYFTNRRNTYVADIRSMSTFCEKFFRLEKVMHQEQGVHQPAPRIKVERS